MSRRHWIRGLPGQLMAGFFLALAIAGLAAGVLWATNALGWRAWRLTEVEHFIGAQLPAGAQAPQFATNQQKTRIVWLRFSLPAETEVSDFLSRMGLVTRDGFTPFPAQNPAEAEIPWWTPQAAQTYSGGYTIRDGKMYEALLDESDPANRIVYLRVYALSMD